MHVKLQKGVREWCMVLSKCGRSCILFTISIILGFIRPIQHCQGFRRFIYPLLNCGRSCILFTINNILRFIWPIQNKTSSLNDTNPQTEEEATQNTVKYELFAVCHHFGGCNGGHYQAKIKIFTDNQWYIFDDNRVQKVGSSVDKDERTAYLLMYLKVDPHTCQEYLRHDIISKYKAEKRKDHEDDERITGKKRNKIDCHQSNKGRCDNSTVAKYEDIESNIVLPKNGEISVVCNRPDSYCYLSKEQNNDHKTDTYIQNSHSQEGLQSNGYQDFSDQSRHQVDHEKIAEVSECFLIKV
ncbi:uncharacterized protein LOC122797954 [Protopterus annectens]|uniref:uncharacterized protein LOC122797954 n=1 Tax=Protopterus annectens TaxID=7888 RepID=UPI001CFC3EDA|nr:uncharacterized protein LOC122797954 [Protopterus annectens]